jgi:hypothetical protein
MADLGVIVTGVVGALGIVGTLIGTWLTGQRQTANLRLTIGAEDKRARTAEKRRIYATCLGAFEEMLVLAAKDRVLRASNDEGSNERWDANFTEPLPAKTAMEAALNETMLIAPREVALRAQVIGRTFFAFTEESAKDPNAEVQLPYGELRTGLFQAMRADLGEDPWVTAGRGKPGLSQREAEAEPANRARLAQDQARTDAVLQTESGSPREAGNPAVPHPCQNRQTTLMNDGHSREAPRPPELRASTSRPSPKRSSRWKVGQPGRILAVRRRSMTLADALVRVTPPRSACIATGYQQHLHTLRIR